MPEVKTLLAMTAEVHDYCRDKGWYDQEVSFDDAVALLHEEAAEAGHAWRHHGFEDATAYPGHVHDGDGTAEGCPGCFAEPKPEGVGAELADLLIRLLDYSTRFDLALVQVAERQPGRFPLRPGFLGNVKRLHAFISQAGEYWDLGDERQAASRLACALRFTVQLADHCGLDLTAEYGRKMAYNRSRPYRHGGLRA